MVSRKKLKFLTVIVAGIIFITQSALAYAPEVNFWTLRQSQLLKRPSSSSLNIKPRISPVLKKKNEINDINMPTQYGSVRSITPGSSDQTIIHIQDIHLNREAQANIAKTIQSLKKQNKLDLLLLEGAFDEIELSQIREFPQDESIKMVSEYLFRENKISGPIYSALTNQSDISPIIGIDNANQYKLNVQAVVDSEPLRNEKIKKLKKDEEELFKRSQSVMSPELWNFQKRINSYRNKELELGDYVSFLLEQKDTTLRTLNYFNKALLIERSLNFSRVEHERRLLINDLLKRLNEKQTQQLTITSRAFKSGIISHVELYTYIKNLCKKQGIPLSRYKEMQMYIQYVLLSEEIDQAQLYKEIRILEKEIYEVLVETSRQRELVKKIHKNYLVQKLVEFSLTRHEWEEYKEYSLRDPPFDTFYKEAEKRDILMAENIEKAMKDYNPQVAVLVTGGFHSAGIQSNIYKSSQSKPTIINFVPQITEVKTKYGYQSLSVFTQKKTPLDLIFEGENLFLPPQPTISNYAFNTLLSLTTMALESRLGQVSQQMGKWIWHMTLDLSTPAIRNVYVRRIGVGLSVVGIISFFLHNNQSPWSLWANLSLGVVAVIVPATVKKMNLIDQINYFNEMLQNTKNKRTIKAYTDHIRDTARKLRIAIYDETSILKNQLEGQDEELRQLLREWDDTKVSFEEFLEESIDILSKKEDRKRWMVAISGSDGSGKRVFAEWAAREYKKRFGNRRVRIISGNRFYKRKVGDIEGSIPSPDLRFDKPRFDNAMFDLFHQHYMDIPIPLYDSKTQSQVSFTSNNNDQITVHNGDEHIVIERRQNRLIVNNSEEWPDQIRLGNMDVKIGTFRRRTFHIKIEGLDFIFRFNGDKPPHVTLPGAKLPRSLPPVKNNLQAGEHWDPNPPEGGEIIIVTGYPTLTPGISELWDVSANVSANAPIKWRRLFSRFLVDNKDKPFDREKEMLKWLRNVRDLDSIEISDNERVLSERGFGTKKRNHFQVNGHSTAEQLSRLIFYRVLTLPGIIFPYKHRHRIDVRRLDEAIRKRTEETLVKWTEDIRHTCEETGACLSHPLSFINEPELSREDVYQRYWEGFKTKSFVTLNLGEHLLLKFKLNPDETVGTLDEMTEEQLRKVLVRSNGLLSGGKIVEFSGGGIKGPLVYRALTKDDKGQIVEEERQIKLEKGFMIDQLPFVESEFFTLFEINGQFISEEKIKRGKHLIDLFFENQQEMWGRGIIDRAPDITRRYGLGLRHGQSVVLGLAPGSLLVGPEALTPIDHIAALQNDSAGIDKLMGYQRQYIMNIDTGDNIFQRIPESIREYYVEQVASIVPRDGQEMISRGFGRRWEKVKKRGVSIKYENTDVWLSALQEESISYLEEFIGNYMLTVLNEAMQNTRFRKLQGSPQLNYIGTFSRSILVDPKNGLSRMVSLLFQKLSRDPLWFESMNQDNKVQIIFETIFNQVPGDVIVRSWHKRLFHRLIQESISLPYEWPESGIGGLENHMDKQFRDYIIPINSNPMSTALSIISLLFVSIWQVVNSGESQVDLAGFILLGSIQPLSWLTQKEINTDLLHSKIKKEIDKKDEATKRQFVKWALDKSNKPAVDLLLFVLHEEIDVISALKDVSYEQLEYGFSFLEAPSWSTVEPLKKILLDAKKDREKSIEQSIHNINYSNSIIDTASIYVLGYHGDPDSINILKTALLDMNMELRKASLAALKELLNRNPSTITPRLVEYYESIGYGQKYNEVVEFLSWIHVRLKDTAYNKEVAAQKREERDVLIGEFESTQDMLQKSHKLSDIYAGDIVINRALIQKLKLPPFIQRWIHRKERNRLVVFLKKGKIGFFDTVGASIKALSEKWTEEDVPRELVEKMNGYVNKARETWFPLTNLKELPNLWEGDKIDFVKLESHHNVGSFKKRAALQIWHWFQSMSQEEREQVQEIVVESTGNQARAVGEMVQRIKKEFNLPNLRTVVFTLDHLPEIKREELEKLGVDLRMDYEDYDHAHDALLLYRDEMAKQNKRILHVQHGSPGVIAGYSTMMVEIVDQLRDYDRKNGTNLIDKDIAVTIPGGSGGDAMGQRIALEYMPAPPNIRIIIVQSTEVHQLKDSLDAGKVVHKPFPPSTISDGIAAIPEFLILKLFPRFNMKPIIVGHNENIEGAQRLMEETGKIHEGSSGLSIAAAEGVEEMVVVHIDTGRNIDDSTIQQIRDESEQIRSTYQDDKSDSSQYSRKLRISRKALTHKQAIGMMIFMFAMLLTGINLILPGIIHWGFTVSMYVLGIFALLIFSNKGIGVGGEIGKKRNKRPIDATFNTIHSIVKKKYVYEISELDKNQIFISFGFKNTPNKSQSDQLPLPRINESFESDTNNEIQMHYTLGSHIASHQINDYTIRRDYELSLINIFGEVIAYASTLYETKKNNGYRVLGELSNEERSTVRIISQYRSYRYIIENWVSLGLTLYEIQRQGLLFFDTLKTIRDNHADVITELHGITGRKILEQLDADIEHYQDDRSELDVLDYFSLEPLHRMTITPQDDGDFQRGSKSINIDYYSIMVPMILGLFGIPGAVAMVKSSHKIGAIILFNKHAFLNKPSKKIIAKLRDVDNILEIGAPQWFLTGESPKPYRIVEKREGKYIDIVPSLEIMGLELSEYENPSKPEGTGLVQVHTIRTPGGDFPVYEYIAIETYRQVDEVFRKIVEIEGKNHWLHDFMTSVDDPSNVQPITNALVKTVSHAKMEMEDLAKVFILMKQIQERKWGDAIESTILIDRFLIRINNIISLRTKGKDPTIIDKKRKSDGYILLALMGALVVVSGVGIYLLSQVIKNDAINTLIKMIMLGTSLSPLMLARQYRKKKPRVRKPDPLWVIEFDKLIDASELPLSLKRQIVGMGLKQKEKLLNPNRSVVPLLRDLKIRVKANIINQVETILHSIRNKLKKDLADYKIQQQEEMRIRKMKELSDILDSAINDIEEGKPKEGIGKLSADEGLTLLPEYQENERAIKAMVDLLYLRARKLYDEGKYKKAQSILKLNQENEFSVALQDLEKVIILKARIALGLKKEKEARHILTTKGNQLRSNLVNYLDAYYALIDVFIETHQPDLVKRTARLGLDKFPDDEVLKHYRDSFERHPRRNKFTGKVMGIIMLIGLGVYFLGWESSLGGLALPYLKKGKRRKKKKEEGLIAQFINYLKSIIPKKSPLEKIEQEKPEIDSIPQWESEFNDYIQKHVRAEVYRYIIKLSKREKLDIIYGRNRDDHRSISNEIWNKLMKSLIPIRHTHIQQKQMRIYNYQTRLSREAIDHINAGQYRFAVERLLQLLKYATPNDITLTSWRTLARVYTERGYENHEKILNVIAELERGRELMSQWKKDYPEIIFGHEVIHSVYLAELYLMAEKPEKALEILGDEQGIFLKKELAVIEEARETFKKAGNLLHNQMNADFVRVRHLRETKEYKKAESILLSLKNRMDSHFLIWEVENELGFLYFVWGEKDHSKLEMAIDQYKITIEGFEKLIGIDEKLSKKVRRLSINTKAELARTFVRNDEPQKALAILMDERNYNLNSRIQWPRHALETAASAHIGWIDSMLREGNIDMARNIILHKRAKPLEDKVRAHEAYGRIMYAIYHVRAQERIKLAEKKFRLGQHELVVEILDKNKDDNIRATILKHDDARILLAQAYYNLKQYDNAVATLTDSKTGRIDKELEKNDRVYKFLLMMMLNIKDQDGIARIYSQAEEKLRGPKLESLRLYRGYAKRNGGVTIEILMAITVVPVLFMMAGMIIYAIMNKKDNTKEIYEDLDSRGENLGMGSKFKPNGHSNPFPLPAPKKQLPDIMHQRNIDRRFLKAA